ncbi:hypothetical protein [Flexivirga sp.]|uniref:hypothetical protein n=1 Tax=Flexivirga sp. TaxID=1962927 RepID=UPI003F8179B7
MRAPVGVSVQDVAGDWHRLPDVGGVQFSTVAPGGCSEATIPLSTQVLLPELQQGCRVRLTDGTTGQKLWTGRLSSPVRQVRGALASGEPSFEGQAGYLGDRTIRYTPLVTRQDAWWLGSTMKPIVGGAQAQSGQLPTNDHVTALMLTLPNGWLRAGDCSLASFHGFYDGDGFASHSSSSIRALIATHQEGAKSANKSKFQVFLWHGSTGGTVSWSSSAKSPAARVTHLFDSTVFDDVTIGYQYNGALVDTSADKTVLDGDEIWSGWWNLQVFRHLRDITGNPIPGWNPIGRGGLLPHEIVTDLVGSMWLDIAINPDRSVIDTTSSAIITSYDFADRASMADILADLNSLVPTHFWWVGPCEDDGSMALLWQPWSQGRTLLMPPGAVTYDEAASDGDLANQLTFAYTDSGGETAYETLFADRWTYPDIARLSWDAYAQVEAPPLDLTSLSSYAAAAQVAQAALAEYATSPKSATATVSVPVVAKGSGAMLQPWALTAGCMAHIPETGETLRVTKVDVDVDTATATLTLGTPRRTTQEIVSTMSRHRKKAN